MYSDLDYFNAIGRQFRFVKIHSPSVLMCWERMRSENGMEAERLGGLEVRSVDIDTLKFLKVWDELTEEMKKEVTEELTKETQAVHERMEKKGCRQKYSNVPRELTCTKCSSKVVIQPGLLVKRVEKVAADKGIIFTVEDYLKQYICKKCGKGDRVANIPQKLTCSCGKEISVVPSILIKRVGKLGVTLENYIKNFKCQVCMPTKGKKSTGKKIIPIELICKCGNTVIYPSSVIKKNAEKKGMTECEYVKGYVCQSCHSTKGRHKKVA